MPRMEHARFTRRAVALALAALMLAASACTSAATPTTPPTVQVSPTEMVVAPTALPPTAEPTATEQPLPNDTPAPGGGPLLNDTPAVSDEFRVYTNKTYGVTLQCPAGWRTVAGEEARLEGEEGFLQLGLISGEGLSIDQVADNEAHHQLQPYGSAPTIEPRQVPGRAARLVMPSDDQPAGMKGQAALVVLMPEPLELDGVTYDYIVLWADQAHIADIGATLTFLPSE